MKNQLIKSIGRRPLNMKLAASFAFVVALAFTGCGETTHEESALEKSINVIFDANPGKMARYCDFHVNTFERGVYDAKFFQSDVRAFEGSAGFKLLREYHEHGVKPEEIVKGINRRCERSGAGDSTSEEKHKAMAQHRREHRRQVQREIAEEQAEIAAHKARTNPVARKVEKAERLNREDAEAQRVENEACHDGGVGALHCEEREEAERVEQICSLSEDEAASYGSEALEVWYATCD